MHIFSADATRSKKCGVKAIRAEGEPFSVSMLTAYRTVSRSQLMLE